MCLVPQECLLSMSDALELGLQVAVSLHVGAGIKPGASARAAANALNHRASSPVTTERDSLRRAGCPCVQRPINTSRVLGLNMHRQAQPKGGKRL